MIISCNKCKNVRKLKAKGLCNNCYMKQYRENNVDKIKEHTKRSNEKSKEYHKNFFKKYYPIHKLDYKRRNRKYKLNKFYNLSLEDYNLLFIKQSGKCAICGIELNRLLRTPDLDHNHITGKVRGILCRKCNNLIYRFDNDVNLLTRIIEYLK